MELHGILSLTLDDIVGSEEYAKGFKDSDGSRSIVVCARRGEDGGEEEVDAILVCANHDCGVALSGDSGDDTILSQGCLKCSAKAPCLSAPESEIVFCTFWRSHSEDWRP